MPWIPSALGRRRRRIVVVASAVLVAAGLLAGRWAVGSFEPAVSPSPVIVLRAAGGEAWVALLRSAGVSARLGGLDDALERRGVVVPAQTKLSGDDRDRLQRFVVEGGRAVVADRPLLERLGFGFGTPVQLDRVQTNGIQGDVTWPGSRRVAPLGTTTRLRGFEALSASGAAVVLARATAGAGTALALAADPFDEGLQGHELFPALGGEAARTLGGADGPRRYAAEIYFDPGNVSLSPAEVAARLQDARAVHVAGWNFAFLSRSFDYPYQELIDALHARGVRAYAWLEPPMVNLGMWTQHPECRERTQSGREAVVDWRSLIALSDARCFDLAWSIWRELLEEFDWDGVNVAELYFEAGSPERFTPFHPSALRAFGGDPAADPEGFLDWRTREVTRLNAELVSRIRLLDPGLDVQLTVIDDELDPKLGREVGSDVSALAAVAREHGAALQVEDPFTTWTDGPGRYETLEPKVTPLLPARRAFFDLNVVQRAYPLPTVQMTGAELSLSVMNAARASGRVAVYAAGTLTDADLAGLPGAVAGGAATEDGSVSAPWSVVVSTPDSRYGRLYLDGRPWPAAAGKAIVPAGRHELAWRAGQDEYPALERLQGELRTASADASTLRISYAAESTAWAVLDSAPRGLRVDGAHAELDVVPNPSGGYTVRLPAGDHDATFSFAKPGP